MPRLSSRTSSIRTGLCDPALLSYAPDELSVRLVATLAAPKVETFIRDMYFEGGDVLICKTGVFRFGFQEGESIDLQPGEALFIYPGNVVTIQSVKAGGSLNYVIFNGTKVSSFLNSFGFYDKLRFKVGPQDDAFKTILQAAEAGSPNEVVLSYVRDVLSNLRQTLRQNSGAALNDAIRVIHENLEKGLVGIKPVCDALNVSRSFLNGLFVRSGIGNPAAFIRREQLSLACLLLRTTDLTIVEIGQRVGIRSPVYFSTFIRRLTGVTPTEYRMRGPAPLVA